jgi:hypothetical protein
MNRPGRPRKLPEASRKLLLTLSEDLIAGLDEWVDEIRSTQIGGSGVTRTDLARDLLARAVDEHRRARGSSTAARVASSASSAAGNTARAGRKRSARKEE